MSRPWSNRQGGAAGAVLAMMLFTLVVAALAAPAASSNRAGLLVQLGDGTKLTRCVAFSEPSISGYELLQRSGLDVATTGGDGTGAAICAIEREGCPADNCFCAFPPNYWSYWLRGDEWQLAPVGASSRRVGDGAVDGWIWGDGSSAPVDLDFNAICGPVGQQWLPMVLK